MGSARLSVDWKPCKRVFNVTFSCVFSLESNSTDEVVFTNVYKKQNIIVCT